MKLLRWEEGQVDYEELEGLDKKLFGLESWSTSNFKMDLPYKRKLSYLLIENDKIEGYAVVYKVNETIAHLSRLGVRSKKKGSGKLLLGAVVQNCKKDFSEMTLEYPKGFEVGGFYTKMGFNPALGIDLKAYTVRMKKDEKYYLNGERIVYQLNLS